MFSSEFYEIFKNIFFIEHFRWLLKPFLVNVAIVDPLKTAENLRFSVVFMELKMGA